MRGSIAPLLLGCAFALGGGCGSRPPIVIAPQEIPAPSTEGDGLAYESPARWVYAPPAAADPIASLALSDGRCVIAGDKGERWVTQRRSGDEAGRCSGAGQAASNLAPEPLTGIVRRSERAWVFVGQSGTLYEAEGPLAPFTRRIRPPRAFDRVVGSDAVLLAISSEGRLMRLGERGAWERVSVGAATGAGVEGRLIDVTVAPDRRALALTVPETLWASEDAGKTWARLPASSTPPIGAHRLGIAAGGDPLVVGVTGSLRWRDRSAVRLEPSTEALEGPPDAGTITVGVNRSVEAIFEGRARLTRQRYYEVRPGYMVEAVADGDDEARESFYLLTGKLDGPVTTAMLPESRRCDQLRLGAHELSVVVACIKTVDDQVVAELSRSRDGGKTWASMATLLTHQSDSLRIAVGPEGQALVTSACPEARASEGGEDDDDDDDDDDDTECEAGLTLLTASGEIARATAPHLLDLPLYPAFSPDGQRAYFLARRVKDERYAVFASRDGGRSFAQRGIELTDLAPELAPGDGETPAEPYDPAAFIELPTQNPLAVDDDGLLGFTALLDGDEIYMMADPDGRILGASRAPAQAAYVSGVGKRVLAVGHPDEDPDHPEPQLARSWESLDGGETWVEVPATLALESAYDQGLVCDVGGCVVGASVARVGWGGQVESFTSSMAPDPMPESRRALRTPLSCELASSQGWRSIPNVHQVRLPGLSETFRGATAWSALSFDPASGALDVHAMIEPEPGERSRLLQRPLLKAHARGQAATEITYQMEGYAAARARVETDAEGNVAPGAQLRDLEVAWENWMDGTSGRRSIPVAGPASPTSVSRQGELLVLETGLLSVSPGGLFVRPSSERPDTYFVDAKTTTTRLDYGDWEALAPNVAVRGDAAAVGQSRFSVGQVFGDSAGALVGLLAHQKPSGEWVVAAQTLGPAASEGDTRSYLDWTYKGTRIGLTVTVSDPTAQVAWSSYYAFEEDGRFGAPEAVPTPFDVEGRVRPCSAEEKKTSARVDAPLGVDGATLFPGTRHPVVVVEPVSGPKGRGGGASLEPVLLLTDGMVLHGPKAQPCVAGWHAAGIHRSPDVVAVIAGDPSTAWLFRLAASGRSLEHRPMTCRFDPGMEIPDHVWRNEGTTVRQ